MKVALQDPIASTKKNMKLSVLEFAQKLKEQGSIEFSAQESLILSDIDLNDFLSIISTEEQPKKLQLLQQMLHRLSLDVGMEGSITLGQFNLDDHSWTISAGDSGSLRMFAKPSLFRRSLNDLVSFLKKLPVGQALVLKPNQDLLLEGFSTDTVLSYYDFCQNTTDAKILETAQDALFIQGSQELASSGLCLKIYAIKASSMNREVNPTLGQIMFKPIGNSELTEPTLFVALVKVEQ